MSVMLDSTYQSELSPELRARISTRIIYTLGDNVQLPDKSKLTYDEKMDFCTIEAAAEYCRLDIVSDISSNSQKYFDLIQSSDIEVYSGLVKNKDYQIYFQTYSFLEFMNIFWHEQMSDSLICHLLPICPVFGWGGEFQKDLEKSVSPDGVFGSNNYDVGYDNSHYTIAAALTYITPRPYHKTRWMEKRFNANRRIRDIQHRCYCGAIRKILQVVDGVEVRKKHFSEPSDFAIVRTYLEVHPPKKLV